MSDQILINELSEGIEKGLWWRRSDRNADVVVIGAGWARSEIATEWMGSLTQLPSAEGLVPRWYLGWPHRGSRRQGSPLHLRILPRRKVFCVQAFLTHQGPSFEGPWLVAGAGFEPATFGL